MAKTKLKPNAIYVIRNRGEWCFLRGIILEQDATFYPAYAYDEYNKLVTYSGCINDDCPAIRTGKDGDCEGFANLSFYQSEYANHNFVEVATLMEEARNGIVEPINKTKENNMEEEQKICLICGEVINEDDFYKEDNDGNYLCDNCIDNGYNVCEDCGKITDDLTWIDGDRPICNDCLDYNYHKCEWCGEYFHEDDMDRTYNDRWVCDHCRNYHYYYCDECGAYVSENDYYYSEREDRRYCPDCWDNRPDEVIGGYHSHVIPAYYNDNGIVYGSKEFEGGYGFELEVDDGNDPDECATELKNLLGDRAWFETDGSLSCDGFEIITSPHTRLAMERDFPLDEMCDILRSYHYKSHDSGNCGLHVHVSRSLFGDTENERTENIAKMVLFYEVFWDDLVKVSRRKYFNYCYKMSSDYKSCNSTGGTPITSEDDAKQIVKDNTENKDYRKRYYSINLENENTVEFRLMRGTLNKDTLKACLDFTMTIVENCKDILMSEVCNKDLWLKGLKETTINYLRKRKAFGYTLEEDDYDTENE